MKKESISQKLLRLLDVSAGKHSQIAKEAGISQATISRIYLRKVSPSLRIAEALMSWFEEDAEKNAACKAALDALESEKQADEASALKLPHTKRIRVQRAGSAAAAAVA